MGDVYGMAALGIGQVAMFIAMWLVVEKFKVIESKWGPPLMLGLGLILAVPMLYVRFGLL